jgi:hypothetical protein
MMKMIVYNVIEYKCVVVSISPHYILNDQQLFKEKGIWLKSVSCWVINSRRWGRRVLKVCVSSQLIKYEIEVSF